MAKDRNPAADMRTGDMHDLPWSDGAFDVVTSFRGIWGTTADALAEVHRVLASDGHLGLTVWGNVKRAAGAWLLAPLALASAPNMEHQAAMVALGRPGAGEDLLGRYGFVDVERVEITCAIEFPDPETYARALASTGPAYEALQDLGEPAWLEAALATAREQVRDGLPLRAVLPLVGYTGRKP